ncbi:ROK family protein [Sphingopyxis sp. PAMC25046]|uniref:ROK family protein n=1 Tax=Sphingopyxis sp. PAMC25046 TaxID=2565556 RepID=UPI00109DB1B2|nr:ROK family protein [Sphingopyxis sp. PAMC25046]QCB55788.1 ROK family protein [Sphingopyxis sp. PAMC25046]
MLAGVELGGTKCICILGAGPDDVRAQVEVPTTSPRATLATIADILDRWNFQTLGIASFGPLDLDRSSTRFGSIVSTPKAGWSGIDLTALARGGPVTIDTDANGAALAEGLWGAAQDLESWAYITVGTGIGVGSIARRQILRGAGHSEAGHQRVPKLAGDMFAGTCVYHGDCVEGLASGPAISARCGKLAHDIPSDDKVWDHVAHALAMLCHNLVLTTLPQRIFVGGGVAAAHPQLIGLLRQHLHDSMAGYGMPADFDDLIVPPGLGHAAGPLGSLALASTVVK